MSYEILPPEGRWCLLLIAKAQFVLRYSVIKTMFNATLLTLDRDTHGHGSSSGSHFLRPRR